MIEEQKIGFLGIIFYFFNYEICFWGKGWFCGSYLIIYEIFGYLVLVGIIKRYIEERVIVERVKIVIYFVSLFIVKKLVYFWFLRNFCFFGFLGEKWCLNWGKNFMRNFNRIIK